jgi:flagellar biosynthesis protein FlhF
MNSELNAASGTCFKFTVDSAEHAARVIRERLGENARVLSVRNCGGGGLLGLFSAPKLEVIAQLVAPKPTPSPEADTEVGAARLARSRYGRANDSRQPKTLTDLLRRSGFSEKLLFRLFESPAWLSLNEMPLHRALIETGRHLCSLRGGRFDRARLTRAAFLGTSGVGRTTALCKWLAAEVFRRARNGHVVMAEFDRPNSAGPLPVFCEAIGVPLAHYPASTRPATPEGFVYFDMPGMSLKHPSDNVALASFLEHEQIEQRVLVLNAAYESGAMRAAYAAGRDLGATHVVFTHVDEVSQWGRLWDYLLEGELEPLFLASGPSLTGDCEEDALDAIVRRTLPISEPDEALDPEDADDVSISTLHSAA